jgi:hypothetical protein
VLQRTYDGSLIDGSAGVVQAAEDIESAIAYGRKMPGVRPGPVLLAGPFACLQFGSGQISRDFLFAGLALVRETVVKSATRS